MIGPEERRTRVRRFLEYLELYLNQRGKYGTNTKQLELSLMDLLETECEIKGELIDERIAVAFGILDKALNE